MMQNPVDPAGVTAFESDSEAKPMMNLTTLSPAVSFHRPFPAIRPGREVKKEVKRKPAQSSYKVGIVTIFEKTTPKRGAAFFELRYIDPDTGKEVKRRVSGLDLDEVKEMAQTLTRKAYHGKGYLAEKVPGIEEGIVEAIDLSRGNDDTKDDLTARAKPFIAFMSERYPAVKTWADIRPGMAEAYLRDCERSGLAYDTIRLRLTPIKAAWKRMHQDYPERVKSPPALKLTPPPRREIVCLEAAEVAVLLDWLRKRSPDLWPMATLQALCGLRMLEAAALRLQDVDLEAGTITITDTGHHKPKTRDSYRTIPICREAVEALREAISSQKVRPTSGEIFTNRKGNLWVKDALTLRWGRALSHISATPKVIKRENTGKKLTINPHGLGMLRLGEIPARKLRSAFATLTGRLGVTDRILKAYLGHSSGDILGGHYRRIDLDELRQVSDTMNGWREAAQAAGARKDSGNIPEKEFASA